jgi:predicted nucleotidyltransferase/uncharacterized protein with HEPN domain
MRDRLLRAARRLPSQVLDERRDEVVRLAARNRLSNVRVFGSVARGEGTLSSDIDLLVSPTSGTSLLDLAGFQAEVEELTGYRVDVVLDRGLDPGSPILADALARLGPDQAQQDKETGGRFAPSERPEAGMVLVDVDKDAKREARLGWTLARINVCFQDADRIVARGREAFLADWILQRAAENTLSELVRAIGRLPRRIRGHHSGAFWSGIHGILAVYQCQDIDSGTVWQALAEDLPRLRASLEIIAGHG